MHKFAVSLVVITLNEEKNIERCIRSVPFVDEVIVLDSGSQDRTVELARSLGAKVITEEWRGYSRQKTRAQELAKNDWILSLDADEALSHDLQEEICKSLRELFKVSQNQSNAEGKHSSGGHLNSANALDAYKMPRLNLYCGRWMRFSGMYPDYQTRFFHRGRAKWLDTEVHEHVVAKNIKTFQHAILHWSFANIFHQIETINKYSSLRARDFQKQGRRFSALKLILKTWSKFIEAYIFKQGFRDGVPGLIASLATSVATFLRWAKLYELERDQRRDAQP